ncbi:hypothetical protein GC207_14165 [bacterium]|nr:hypothetical protein [bacterium]
MKLPRNAKVFRGQLDVAPFMGVFLLMLLFIVLRQQITFVPGLSVALPEAVNLSGIQGPAVTVIMDRQGQVFFDNQMLNPAQPGPLTDFLRKSIERAGTPVTLIVQADRDVRLGDWTRLNLAAREAGVHDVLLAIRSRNGTQ